MDYKISYIKDQYDLDKYINGYRNTILLNTKFLFNYPDYCESYNNLKNLVDLEFVASIWNCLYEDQIIKVNVKFENLNNLELPFGTKTRSFITYIINLPRSRSYWINFWLNKMVLDGEVKYSNSYYQYGKFGVNFLDMDPQSIYNWTYETRLNQNEHIVTADVPELGFMKAQKNSSLCYSCKYYTERSMVHCAVNPCCDCSLTFFCKDYHVVD